MSCWRARTWRNGLNRARKYAECNDLMLVGFWPLASMPLTLLKASEFTAAFPPDGWGIFEPSSAISRAEGREK